MTFHMVRVRLGDERFVAALRAFYAEQRFRAASFTDLARAIGAAAGEDLAPFFAQWVDRPGAPALRVESAEVVTGSGAPALVLDLAQTQDGEPFTLDVPVYLTLPSSRRRSGARCGSRSGASDSPSPSRRRPCASTSIRSLTCSARLDPAEVPPALSGAFGAARRVIVLPAAAPPPLAAAYRALAESWKNAGTEIVTDADLPRLPGGRRFGCSGGRTACAPPRRRRSRATARRSATGSSRPARRGSRARTARSSRRRAAPRIPAQVVAFLGADRAAALPGLARKLPHYGKYGLLGFEGDQPANVAKETWTVLASPMAVAL